MSRLCMFVAIVNYLQRLREERRLPIRLHYLSSSSDFHGLAAAVAIPSLDVDATS